MNFLLLWSFLLWLAATLILRFAGQFFPIPENPVLTFLVVTAAVPIITYPIYAWRQISPSNRLLAAVYLSLPGMFLDTFTVLFFPTIFPNTSPDAAVSFSSALLWGYGLILMTGFLPQPQITGSITEKSFSEKATSYK